MFLPQLDELDEAKKKISILEEEIKFLLIPKDPRSNKKL